MTILISVMTVISFSIGFVVLYRFLTTGPSFPTKKNSDSSSCSTLKNVVTKFQRDFV